MSEKVIYDCIVIGGGPAGLTASIYLGSANKSVLVINSGAIGGKITESAEVRNIPGFSKISGIEFGEKLWKQASDCGVQFEWDNVIDVDMSKEHYIVYGECGQYFCNSIIIATGTVNRLLGIPTKSEYLDEEMLLGKGVHTCALCDGIFYKDKKVAVVGGGNGALTEALYLSDICEKVYILQNLDRLTADKVLVDLINNKSNIEVCLKTIPTLYAVDYGKVSGLYADDKFFGVSGVFISIGVEPNTKVFKRICLLDDRGFIRVTDDMEVIGSPKGVFACGDCTNGKIKQVSVACGQGTIAAKSVIEYINKQKEIM